MTPEIQNTAQTDLQNEAEVGFTPAEAVVPEIEVLSLFQRAKRNGKEIIGIIKKASPEDVIRGINQL